VLEFFQQLDLVVDVLNLFMTLPVEFDLLDDVLLLLLFMAGQVGISEGSDLSHSYPCPIIFKIS